MTIKNYLTRNDSSPARRHLREISDTYYIHKLIEEERPSAKSGGRKKEILLVPMPESVPCMLD